MIQYYKSLGEGFVTGAVAGALLHKVMSKPDPPTTAQPQPDTVQPDVPQPTTGANAPPKQQQQTNQRNQTKQPPVQV